MRNHSRSPPEAAKISLMYLKKNVPFARGAREDEKKG
jgi:hypothetical protein